MRDSILKSRSELNLMDRAKPYSIKVIDFRKTIFIQGGVFAYNPTNH